jgi:hypothetical protein
MRPVIDRYYRCPVCNSKGRNESSARNCCEIPEQREYRCGKCGRQHESEEMARVCCDGEAMLELQRQINKEVELLQVKKNTVHNMIICLKEEQNA